MSSPNIVLDSVRQAAIRAEARFAALRALRAAFKAWSAETNKSQKELAQILNADPAHVSRVLAGDKRSMTIETLFLFARAMDRRPSILMESLNTLSAKKPNYDARPNFVQFGADFPGSGAKEAVTVAKTNTTSGAPLILGDEQVIPAGPT